GRRDVGRDRVFSEHTAPLAQLLEGVEISTERVDRLIDRLVRIRAKAGDVELENLADPRIAFAPERDCDRQNQAGPLGRIRRSPTDETSSELLNHPAWCPSGPYQRQS